MNKSRPIVIGHRGAAGEAPENTLASFELALEQGAEGVELDVHLTSDGELVVCHDPTLERTTNGAGLISGLAVEDIQRWDAGSWFSPRFRGEKIPLLSEVLALVPAHIWVNVEIKQSQEGRLEPVLMKLLAAQNRLDRTIVSSFDHKCVQNIKQINAQAKAGLLYAADLFDHAAYAQMLPVDIYSLHPHYQLLGSADVRGARTAGLHVFPYTANEEEDFRRLIDWGVSGIITDVPGKLREFIEREA